MAGSAATEKMYRGELDHEEGDSMPRTSQEAYNATRSDEPAKISDEPGIEYDEELMGETMEAYENFDPETEYSETQLLEDEDALDAFGQLWSEN